MTKVIVSNPTDSAGSSPADLSVPQTDDELETATTAVLLVLSSAAQDQVLRLIADTDLRDRRLRFLVSTARAMRAAGVPVDQRTMFGWVERNALLPAGQQRGVLAVLLAELVSSAPDPVSANWLAALTVEKAARRRVRAAGERLIEIAEGGGLGELRQVVQAELGTTTAAIIRAERVIG